ncbi:hypothetical protein HYV86_03710 [Candidatus Woesearchaeota archaeon]|nr:hypothetical protein [Candidatus Woesearchaeota archaeon]
MKTRDTLSSLEIEVGLEQGTLTESQIGEFVDLGYVTRREGQVALYSSAVPDVSFNYSSRTMRQIEPDVFVTPGFVDYVNQSVRNRITPNVGEVEMPRYSGRSQVGYSS